MVIQIYRRLDSREALKIKDPLEDDVMKVFVFSKDDVTAGYKVFSGRRGISSKY